MNASVVVVKRIEGTWEVISFQSRTSALFEFTTISSLKEVIPETNKVYNLVAL